MGDHKWNHLDLGIFVKAVRAIFESHNHAVLQEDVEGRLCSQNDDEAMVPIVH